MRKILISASVLSLLLFGELLGQLTLDSCQIKAKNNYPLINQYDLIEQSKEYSLSNAGKSYLPQLSITAIGGVVDGFPEMVLPGQEPSSSSNYKLISMIQINQNIWDGGTTSANKDIITAESGIEMADISVSMYKLENRVNGLYFGILLIDEQEKQLEILKRTLERNLKNVKTAVDNGIAYKSDIDELKVEILGAEQRIYELSFNKDAYIKMLSAFIGEPISDSEKFERPTVDNKFYELGINRPELSMFTNQKTLIEAKYQMSKTSLFPKIGLMGFGVFINPGVNFGGSDVTRLLVGGLSLSWELGGLYRNSNNSDMTQVGIKKVNTLQETFLFNTNLELNQKEREIEKYKALIVKDKEIVELKRRIKKSYETKYDNGVCTMSQLLDRINDENIAFQNMIKNEIQFLMMVKQYKNISGN